MNFSGGNYYIYFSKDNFFKRNYSNIYRSSPPEGIGTIAPEENCPPVKVRVNFRVGGQFSLGAIVLEPLQRCY